MPGIDFFDVDHTLTRGRRAAGSSPLAMRRRVLPLRLLFVIPWYSLTYRLGLFRPALYEEGFPYLRGLPLALEKIARESFETQG